MSALALGFLPELLPELARPQLLFLLLALPLWWLFRRRRERRRRIPYPPLQYHPGRPWRRWIAASALPLELLLLALVVAALAGPYRSRELELLEDEGIDVALVLDVSLSMLAEDFPPNRLEALRAVARDFIHQSGSNRVGLVIFAKDVFVQAPLTADHPSLLQLLEGVTPHAIDQAKSGGTAIGDALLVGAERLAKARRPGRDQALVLITDGESNAGAEPALAARYARHLGIRLYILGIGGSEPVEVFFEGKRVGGDDPYLAVLEDSRLEELAAAGGGRYFRATDMGSLEGIFAELSRLETAPLESRRVELRSSLAPWLAAAALPLFALQLLVAGVVARRPWR